MSTRKERARKGTDNDLNEVGPWAIVLCMLCKPCTGINTDEALETCLVPDRGQSFQEHLPYFYVLSSPACDLAELEQCSGTPDFTHLISITLFQRPFTFPSQSKLTFLFVLSSPFSFPPFPSFLCSTRNFPHARRGHN